ncbi:conserved hypothetical protein [Dehalogenimonas lykanthroporepellens BL-DC-9]|nr:conserved hypothetical protein [Dehalogenimonas lykanthroporepellens BL-DC-9]
MVNDTIYEKLKQIATNQSITYYSEIAPLASLNMSSPEDRNKIAHILDQINIHEREVVPNRPMLSAVVILKDDNMPGSGFFNCAEGLGKFNGDTDDKKRTIFWSQELKRVYDYWGKPID